jgi:hypothetical protein
MKTVRISRQNFPNNGQFSWLRYLQFVLSKKYNVIIDAENPDLILTTNLYYSDNIPDYAINHLPTKFNPTIDKDKKFLYVSGELADFHTPLLTTENLWSMGYQKFEHPRYFRQPSCVFDVWTIFDESRMTDCPLCWLTETRNFEQIKKRNSNFCCITQASHNDYREKIFDELSKYKTVSSSGPWKQNIPESELLNKYKWQNGIYMGRIDGLTYREKIEFFQKYKFNISVQFTNTPYVVQEKLIHAYFAGCIPIYFGNDKILEEGFNPETFINLHDYDEFGDVVDLVKKIDSNDFLYRKYIESPIFVDNKLPDYYNFDYVLNFLEKIIES